MTNRAKMIAAAILRADLEMRAGSNMYEGFENASWETVKQIHAEMAALADELEKAHMPTKSWSNPAVPEPEVSSVDGTFTNVTIAVNGVWITVAFESDAEAQRFVDQYANATRVTGSEA